MPPLQRKQSADLAMAFLGAHSTVEVRIANIIDRHVRRVLGAADGYISLAAELLGMHRHSLQRFLRRRRPSRRRRGK